MDNIEKYNKIGAMLCDDWSGDEDSFVEMALEILNYKNKPKATKV